MNTLIIFDTETTFLCKPDAAPLSQQPSIIEFAAVKVADDEEMNIIDELEFKCKPPNPLSEDIKKFHKKTNLIGLSDEDLKDCEKFPYYYPMTADFFLHSQTMVAHNVAFDRNLLKFELMRMGKVLNFPWPIDHICTVERTFNFKGYRLSLQKLWFDLFAKEMVHKHRAMDDVKNLLTIVRELRKRGIL